MDKIKFQYAREEARIYRNYYRKSGESPLSLLKSVLCLLVSGNAPFSRPYYVKKEKQLLK
jgi:hypothetical protein